MVFIDNTKYVQQLSTTVRGIEKANYKKEGAPYLNMTLRAA